jgi:hypothetical protein
MHRRNASTSAASPAELPPRRERRSTPALATRWRGRHAAAAALALAALAACGGRHTDSYQQATSKQETCCEHLTGAERDQCLAQIVRVGDPGVAASDANQATYRCVEDHFACDPASGHATRESAQEQYDCIADLGL